MQKKHLAESDGNSYSYSVLGKFDQTFIKTIKALFNNPNKQRSIRLIWPEKRDQTGLSTKSPKSGDYSR